jgi:RNA polymerase sigma-70 factor (ECF subfamily)
MHVANVGYPMGGQVQVRAAWLVLRPLLSLGDDGLGTLSTDTSAPAGGARVLDVDAAVMAPFASGLDGLAVDAQLEQLILLHGEAVYRVALSVVRDPMSAEDVAQEALLKAWQALPGYRGEAPLRSWLLRITHNTAVSWLRKRREEPLDPQLFPERAPSDSTEHAVERRAAMAAFEHALAGLDDLSRSIIVLRELEGLAYEDIAEVLGVPLPTVKTRLLRARRLLSTSLEGWRP